MFRSILFSPLLFAACASLAHAQPLASDPSESGGVLIYEQAAYDVHYYDLQLAVMPAQAALAGRLSAHVTITLPTDALVLDLDTTFAVARIEDERGEALAFERLGGRLWIHLGATRQPGDAVVITVDYAGRPRIAPNPPWQGGFTWAARPDGTFWVGVSCQGEGADLWWPVKDHPSDEPDSLRIRATVPAGHTAVSAGRLQRETVNDDGTVTFDWLVSTPINNYGLSLYVAPYEAVSFDYTSTSGGPLPITFYALPEDRANAERLLPQIAEHVRFMEETFGPYPFRADKYAVVQSPYLGMEHQTAIAYGDEFEDNEYGFDWLHFHELAHEWWGNLVTVPDWRHFWVHEGTATYAGALYAEHLGGAEAYRRSLLDSRARIQNQRPVVPAASIDTQDAYFGQRGTTGATDADVYFKGAWFLHTLRWAINDDAAFFRGLRRVLYPTPEMEAVTDGRQARFVTTDDVQRILEVETGRDLEDLFRLYLDQPALPRLVSEREPAPAEAGGDTLRLRWETPEGYPLELPVEVSVDGNVQRVPMPGGSADAPRPGRGRSRSRPERPGAARRERGVSEEGRSWTRGGHEVDEPAADPLVGRVALPAHPPVSRCAARCLSSSCSRSPWPRGGSGAIRIGAFSQSTPGALPEKWKPLPLGDETPSVYAVVRNGDRTVVKAEADDSASGLVRPLRLDARRYPILEWSWNVEKRDRGGPDGAQGWRRLPGPCLRHVRLRPGRPLVRRPAEVRGGLRVHRLRRAAARPQLHMGESPWRDRSAREPVHRLGDDGPGGKWPREPRPVDDGAAQHLRGLSPLF